MGENRAHLPRWQMGRAFAHHKTEIDPLLHSRKRSPLWRTRYCNSDHARFASKEQTRCCPAVRILYGAVATFQTCASVCESSAASFLARFGREFVIIGFVGLGFCAVLVSLACTPQKERAERETRNDRGKGKRGGKPLQACGNPASLRHKTPRFPQPASWSCSGRPRTGHIRFSRCKCWQAPLWSWMRMGCFS